MAERVVDLLEPVKVDDSNRCGSTRRTSPAGGVLPSSMEQCPVRKIREGIVLSHVGVDRDLMPQLSSDREGDAEQGDIQSGQSDGEVSIETVDASVDFGLDRSVGQIDLEHPHPMGR